MKNVGASLPDMYQVYHGLEYRDAPMRARCMFHMLDQHLESVDQDLWRIQKSVPHKYSSPLLKGMYAFTRKRPQGEIITLSDARGNRSVIIRPTAPFYGKDHQMPALGSYAAGNLGPGFAGPITEIHLTRNQPSRSSYEKDLPLVGSLMPAHLRTMWSVTAFTANETTSYPLVSRQLPLCGSKSFYRGVTLRRNEGDSFDIAEPFIIMEHVPDCALFHDYCAETPLNFLEALNVYGQALRMIIEAPVE